MKSLKLAFLLLLVFSSLAAETLVQFDPPKDWRSAEVSELPPSVKLMIVGSGSHEFPPNINLGTEKYSGTIKDYLKKIKSINAAKGLQWKSLGIIQTKAGPASLSQVDSTTVWGNVRMMHIIIKHEDTIYIMTAAALKDEFPKFYNDFFTSFRSLHFDDVGSVATP